MSLPVVPDIAPVVAPAIAPAPPPPPPVLSFNCTSIICYNNQLSDNQIVTTQVSYLSHGTLFFLSLQSQASCMLSTVLCFQSSCARLQSCSQELLNPVLQAVVFSYSGCRLLPGFCLCAAQNTHLQHPSGEQDSSCVAFPVAYI